MKRIPAVNLVEGMWLQHADSRFNSRIVEVAFSPTGHVKVQTDSGHGGEADTMIFEPDQNVLVQMH